MRLVAFYFLPFFFIAPNALAENNQVISSEKNNIEAKSGKIKKMPSGAYGSNRNHREDYPGIQFQKYLQQNPISENEANEGQKEISQHKNYPELKQYSIVTQDKKLEESKKLEEKNGQETEQIVDLHNKTSDEQIFFRQIFNEHNYNQPPNEQLWE